MYDVYPLLKRPYHAFAARTSVSKNDVSNRKSKILHFLLPLNTARRSCFGVLYKWYYRTMVQMINPYYNPSPHNVVVVNVPEISSKKVFKRVIMILRC